MPKRARSKTSRKRKKSRLDNLKKAWSKIAEKKGRAISTLSDADTKLQTNATGPKKPKLTRCRISLVKSRFQQSRKCVTQLEGNAYKEDGISRGKGGGYCASLRSAQAQFCSVRALQSNRERNRTKNQKMKMLSRSATVTRQRERRAVAKIAYDKLLQVCF